MIESRRGIESSGMKNKGVRTDEGDVTKHLKRVQNASALMHPASDAVDVAR
jgi:hypothetical protein